MKLRIEIEQIDVNDDDQVGYHVQASTPEEAEGFPVDTVITRKEDDRGMGCASKDAVKEFITSIIGKRY